MAYPWVTPIKIAYWNDILAHFVLTFFPLFLCTCACITVCPVDRWALTSRGQLLCRDGDSAISAE